MPKRPAHDDEDNTGLQHELRKLRSKKKPDTSCVVVVDRNWRVMGSGKSLAAALEEAHEYAGGLRCPHCGKNDEADETKWRAYAFEREAWEMLTCGGDTTDQIREREHFTWNAELGAFVWVCWAYCITCRGSGWLRSDAVRRGEHVPVNERRVQCPAGCRGGVIDPDVRCVMPPKEAALWSGAKRRRQGV